MTAVPRLRLAGVSNFILRDLSLEVADGEYLVLLGPNGAGKTTLLNVIAGLIGHEGEIFASGERIDRLPPRRRGIGFLFQDLYLFPHLSVRENIAYGPRAHGVKGGALASRVAELLAMMKLEALAERHPRTLSAGERQKTALARAIIGRPGILLLDEPFAAIDATLKERLWLETRHFLKELGITVIHVTHDIEEAHVMADAIAILIEGGIEQRGGRDEVLKRPATRRVVEYFGLKNHFHGRIVAVSREENFVAMETPLGALTADWREGAVPGDEVGVSIWPQDIKILDPDRELRPFLRDNVFSGRIERLDSHGIFHGVTVRLDSGAELELKLPSYIVPRLGLGLGLPVRVSPVRNAIHLLV